MYTRLCNFCPYKCLSFNVCIPVLLVHLYFTGGGVAAIAIIIVTVWSSNSIPMSVVLLHLLCVLLCWLFFVVVPGAKINIFIPFSRFTFSGLFKQFSVGATAMWVRKKNNKFSHGMGTEQLPVRYVQCTLYTRTRTHT